MAAAEVNSNSKVNENSKDAKSSDLTTMTIDAWLHLIGFSQFKDEFNCFTNAIDILQLTKKDFQNDLLVAKCGIKKISKDCIDLSKAYDAVQAAKDEQNSNDNGVTEKLNVIYEEIKKVNDKVDNIVASQVSPWDEISEQTSVAHRDAMRDILKEGYNINIAYCMISGVTERFEWDNNRQQWYNTGGVLGHRKIHHSNPNADTIAIKFARNRNAEYVLKYKIVGAHIVPYSQAAKYQASLNKEYNEKFDANSCRNGLLLCSFLEQAYDQRKFTLIPANALNGTKSLKVYVLDRNDAELMQFDGKYVSFPKDADIRPYNRAIMWHCKDAFKYAYHTKGWITSDVYEQYKTMKDISQKADSDTDNKQDG